MKRLQVIDCLWPLVKRVSFDAHPEKISEGGIFAVFTAAGDFYGLIPAQTALAQPNRRYGDLVTRHPLASIKPTHTLAHCLRQMKKHRQDCLPVIDQSGRFLGVVTQKSLLSGLVRQENLLLRKAEHFLQAAEEKHQQLEQWSERLAELQTASRMLLHVLSHTKVEKDLLQTAVEALARLLNARYAALSILAEDGSIAEFVTTGISQEVAARIGAPPTGKGLLGIVIQQDRALRLDDLAAHPQSAGFPPNHPPMKTLLAVPVSHLKRVYGRIYLCDKLDGKPFTAEDELLASNFAHSLSLILDNAKEAEKVIQTTQRLDHLTHHDPLTGLPNFQLLRDRLDMALLQAQRHCSRIALLLVDIDDFKRLNDVHGHAIGNDLLKLVAHRLTKCIREGDTVARSSGDEFFLLLQDIDIGVDAAAIAEKILETLAQPFQVQGLQIFLTASIGIGVSPDDATEAEDLIRFTDTAMSHAKQSGGNVWRFFTPALNERLHAYVCMEDAMRQALPRNELSLAYQPQVDIASGRIVGAEALLRWRSAELGEVPPSAFIPVAEATGQIIQIGDWVLATACAQGKRWLDAGYDALSMAVNVSARQFHHAGFVSRVQAILADSGLPPERLDLELTESLLIDAESEIITTLNQLRALGVQISIDDFGTGYSSLSRLKKFPVSALKVDQSFVNGISEDDDDAAIVKTIIALGHSLHLKVIAEGVETPAHLAFLREHRCDIMQGYLFSRPIPADAFLALLDKNRQDSQKA
jgi:diguanylate cyclase (GGDEF)-like protein